MNKDIRLLLSFRNHPKTKKLRFKFGNDGIVSYIWLLMFAAESKSDGVLDGMDEIDIALAADWQGEPEEFVRFLVDVRLLDFDGQIYAIHDWEENNPYAAGATERSERARKGGLAKAAKERKRATKNQELSEKNAATSRNKQCCKQESVVQVAENSTAPSPSPSPSPLPEPKKQTPSSESKIPPCPHEAIIAAYHELLPERPRVTPSLWRNSKHAEALKARWRENPQHQSVDWWRGLFEAVQTNDFWMNRDGKWNGFNLRWMVNKTNFIKCVEHWANAA